MSAIGNFNGEVPQIAIKSIDQELVNIIHSYFGLSTKIRLVQTSYVIRITHANDIMLIINKLHLSPCKLVGYNRAAYLLFLNSLNNHKKFSKFHIPLDY